MRTVRARVRLRAGAGVAVAGRIRTLKPELLTDAKAARLSDSAWRLFVSCLLLADDFGRFAGDPVIVGGQVFPTKPAKAEAAIVELVKAGMLLAYQVRGQAYLAIANWTKHQRIDNAGKQRCPGPEEMARGDSPRNAESLGDPSSVPGNLPPDPDPDLDPEREGRGNGRKRPLPSDWSPKPENQALALENGKNLSAEAIRFRDWAAGKGEKKVDWDATFRNWLRNDFGGGKATKPKQRARDPALDLLDKANAGSA